MSFSWLKLLSLSHNVMGRVSAGWSSTLMLGNVMGSCRTSTDFFGRSDWVCCFHFLTHIRYSMGTTVACGHKRWLFELDFVALCLQYQHCGTRLAITEVVQYPESGCHKTFPTALLWYAKETRYRKRLDSTVLQLLSEYYFDASGVCSPWAALAQNLLHEVVYQVKWPPQRSS